MRGPVGQVTDVEVVDVVEVEVEVEVGPEAIGEA